MGIINIPDELVAYENGFPTIRPHPKTISIDNWGYIMYGTFKENSDLGRGCYILLHANLYFIPGVIPDQLLHLAECDEVMQAYYFPVNFGASWCDKCRGAGKLSWIDNAKGGAEWNNILSKNFERNPDVLYCYSTSNKHTSALGTKLLFLSSTIVGKGEVFCTNCRGTGLWLNATTYLFKGFRHLRAKLYDKKRHPLYDTITNTQNLERK